MQGAPVPLLGALVITAVATPAVFLYPGPLYELMNMVVN